MPRTRSLAWAELKIGILAVAAIVIAGFVIFTVGGQTGFFTDVYHLKTRFGDVQGLKEGAVVRVAGVEVGTVTAVQFEQAQVEVVMELPAEMQPRITTLSRASIGSLSLLGEPVIDINAAAAGEPLDDWSYIESAPAGGQLSDVAESATATIEQVSELLANVRKGEGTLGRLVTDEGLYQELEGLMSASREVARGLSDGRGTLGRLLQDPSAARSLEASLQNLQGILARIREGEGSLGRLVNDPAFAESLSGATQSFRTLAARLNEGEGTMGKLLTEEELYDRLNAMIGRLDQVTARLDQGEGTMGQLLRDEELYRNLNQSVSELQALLQDIRQDPKKFLNVRVSIF